MNKEKTRDVSSKFDFISKLCQPSVLPRVIEYIEWQKKVRSACIAGVALPDFPSSVLPVSINLDLTTACNFRCGHCIDLDVINDGAKYEYDSLVETLEKMIEGGLKSVIIIGGGEPTIHPKFTDVVRFLKLKGLQVAIVSNGSNNRIVYEIVDCLDSGDWIRFSLDAGNNESFIKIHNPRNSSVNLNEICSWVPRIRERNSEVSVGFSFVITWENAVGSGSSNISEIVAAAELAKKYGFNYISFKPFLMRSNEGAEVVDTEAIANFNRTITRIREELSKSEELETDEFKVVESINLRLLLGGNWRDFSDQPKNCHMQVLRQVLSPLGLFNCPACRGVENARIGDYNVLCGSKSLFSDSLAAVIDRFDASIECRESICLYNSVNWWIERAINGEIDPSESALKEELNDYFL